MIYPLMPKATAVWLIKNTILSFCQIADFCNLDVLEIQGIADGEICNDVKGIDPIISNQLTNKELQKCEKNSKIKLIISKSAIKLHVKRKINNNKKYVPKLKRQNKSSAILWILQNYPSIADIQISKLTGATKNNINLIRGRTYWNYNNITAKDPVLLGLCSQSDLYDANKLLDNNII